MKRLLLLVFLFSGFMLSGQVTISPNPISLDASHRVEDIEIDFTVTNDDVDAEVQFYWRIANSPDIPSPWEAYICDTNVCYTSAFHTCPEGNPNILEAGASHLFQFHVEPHKLETSFTFVFELFSVTDPEDVYDVIEISLNTLATSTNDASLETGYALYPNPTVESFQISNDQNIKNIAIYNIVGKQIYNFRHTAGKFYNISELRKGMYLVRLFDNDGKTVKSLRLSKK